MQNEKAEEIEWLHFDSTPVDEVDEVLREWPNSPPAFDSNEDEESSNLELDCYHCGQA
jgi:hypothetical protein